MSLKFVQAIASVLILLFSQILPASATDRLTKNIWIDGHGYDAVLEPSRQVQMTGAAEGESLAGEHYRGVFPEDPDSWIRISRLDSGWEGMAFVFGRMHTLGGSSQSGHTSSFSFSQMEAPQCGVDHIHGETAITPDSLADTAMVQAVSANYDTLCADKVDGACLMMELELAFDQQFQTRFNDYEGRAGAILNMVEGFYADQFGIVFDTLSLTFMEAELFDKTTDAGDLLWNVRDTRDDGKIPFLKSDQSIFHFITGRDFAGQTAGIAFTGTVCSSDAFATGITNAFDSDALTAVVVAHEIGHNLGSGHDGGGTNDNGCPVDGDIMSPSVSGNASEFSSCSFRQITDTISDLDSVEQCFNFPADAGLAGVDGNPLEVEQGASFQTSFNVDYQQASQSADSLTITGVVGENEGQLQGVSVDGKACDLLLDETSFRCTGVAARANLPISINAIAGSGSTFTLLQNVELASNTGDVKDIRPGNDSLLTEITLAPSSTPESDPPESDPPAPDEDEDSGTPREPDPETDTDTSGSGGSSSGGGGGGAMHWLWLLMGVAGVGIRRRGLV